MTDPSSDPAARSTPAFTGGAITGITGVTAVIGITAITGVTAPRNRAEMPKTDTSTLAPPVKRPGISTCSPEIRARLLAIREQIVRRQRL